MLLCQTGACVGTEDERVWVRTDLAWSLPHLGHLVPVPRKLSVKLADLDLNRPYARVRLEGWVMSEGVSSGPAVPAGPRGTGGELTEAIASVSVGLGVAFEFPNRRFIGGGRRVAGAGDRGFGE